MPMRNLLGSLPNSNIPIDIREILLFEFSELEQKLSVLAERITVLEQEYRTQQDENKAVRTLTSF